MEARTWKLELTEEQFNCIARGMEYYHRMMCGDDMVVDDVCENRIDDTLRKELKKQMFPELMPNESYGWNGTDKSHFGKEMAMSYQIYREMIHKRTIRDGVDNVYSSETLSSGKADKLIVEQIKK
jgi:hypothetical protein